MSIPNHHDPHPVDPDLWNEAIGLATRLVRPTLNRVLRFKGLTPRDLDQSSRDDIQQEVCVRWVELRHRGWRPANGSRSLDESFMRLVGRCHYALVHRANLRAPNGSDLSREATHGEPVAAADPYAELLTSETLERMNELPFPADRLLAMWVDPSFRKGPGRPNVLRMARELGLEVRQVRRRIRVLLETAGQDGARAVFWLRRLGEALLGIACRRLLAEDPRLLSATPPDLEQQIQRAQQSLGMLTDVIVAPSLGPELRRARTLVLGCARGTPTPVLETLDLVARLRGPSTTVALWQAEHHRQRGQVRQAGAALERATALARTTDDRRRVALGKARLAEHQGRYREGLLVLEQITTRDAAHPILRYDRMVLATLAGFELDPYLRRLSELNLAQRSVCKGFVRSDQGPFGRRLERDERLRRRVMAALA